MPVNARFIDIETLKSFSTPKPWRWMGAALIEWTIILGFVWASIATGFWPLWIVSIFVIGTRQHALGILAHEATHSLVSRDRRLNDLLGDLFAAYPISYPVEGYRTAHLKHHRTLDTAADPERASVDLYPQDWTFPISRRRAVWLLVRDVFGFHQLAVKDLIHYIWQFPDGRWWPHLLKILVWHGAVIAAAIATGNILAYVVLWVVPLLTVAVLCFRVRTVAEHSGIYPGQVRFQRETVDTPATTRTIVGSRFMQFLFGPYNMCYHVEHHLYPGVPVFDLRRLHTELMKNESFVQCCHETATYGNLFDELTIPTAAAA